MKDKPVLLRIVSIRELRANAYVVILTNIENTHRLPIVIGAPEARAIAFSLEGLHSERPITHDLLITMLQSFNISIEKVVIVRLEQGVFFSEITLKQNDTVINIDARPSDAIAIALRFKRPIFCNKKIMEEAAVELQTTQKQEETPKQKQFTKLKINELKLKMQEASENENYELAAEIKKEIEQKKAEYKKNKENNE